jgi:hypothetical protein
MTPDIAAVLWLVSVVGLWLVCGVVVYAARMVCHAR